MSSTLKESNTNDSCSQCDLDREFTKEDEEALTQLNLSEEVLKLKNEDPAKFWKLVCEEIREMLDRELTTNQEVCFFLSSLVFFF